MRLPTRRNAVAFVFAVALAAAGCASAGGSTRPEGATTNRIVREELVPIGQLDALQAIQRLRPRWLQSRGGVGGEAPVLYVDGARRGSADELRFIRASEVEQAEYLSSSEATNRFGTGHTGGAILVSMIR